MNRCELCGELTSRDPHHIMHQGRWGEAALIKINEIWLCGKHHIEVHTIGRWTFAAKYGLTKRFKKAQEAVYEKARCLQWDANQN